MEAPERAEVYAALKQRSAELQAGEDVGVSAPKDWSFDSVNNWIHHDDPSNEELGWTCLSLATALERAWVALRSIAAQQGAAPVGFAQRAMAEIAKEALIETKAS